MTKELFNLPDVGEGLTEAEIVSWHVAVGDTVTVNQIIVDIETAKSVVELPSPYAGTVAELLAAPGETVDVGKPIIAIETSGNTGSSPTPTPESVNGETTDEPKLLVGYGARETTGSRRRRGGKAGASASAPTASTPRHQEAAAVTHQKVRAKPPVRKLATVLGVDVTQVTPTAPEGIVMRGDVLAHAKNHPANHHDNDNAARNAPAAEGEVQRYPIKGVRKHTAAAMVSSAFTAVHVTEFITVDVTDLLALRDRVQARREFRDVKLTPLAFIAKAYMNAIARTPVANGRWDEAAQEIVVPTDVNLGIAAATPRGLMVPNIRAANRLTLLELATSITELATTARAGKAQPEQMSGGTTTISNIGVFGIDTGTPILNPGETSILAVGTIKRMPWVVEDHNGERIEPRSVLQLALSFDHRVMDGEEGSNLLAHTAAVLADPGLGLL